MLPLTFSTSSPRKTPRQNAMVIVDIKVRMFARAVHRQLVAMTTKQSTCVVGARKHPDPDPPRTPRSLHSALAAVPRRRSSAPDRRSELAPARTEVLRSPAMLRRSVRLSSCPEISARTHGRSWAKRAGHLSCTPSRGKRALAHQAVVALFSLNSESTARDLQRRCFQWQGASDARARRFAPRATES